MDAEVQDSLGSLIIRSGYSANSVTKFEERVGPPVTADQLTDELTRLNAAFGNPRDRTADQARVMANEWFKAISGFGANVLHVAVDRLIATWVPSYGRTWPSIAECVALCQQETSDWRDVYGIRLERLPTHHADEDKISIDEIIRRSAVCTRLHTEFPNVFNGIDPLAPEREASKPASTEMWMSDALRNSCAAKRARGQQTCEPSCCRRQCPGAEDTI